jgi:hypothetical protein
MFDPTKPVQTRDGRDARILATDGRCEDAPLIVEVVDHDGRWKVDVRRADGRATWHGPNDDLVNAPEKRRLKGWVNVYTWESARYMYSSKENADALSVCSDGRVACVEIDIEYTVGEGLEHE